MTPTTVRGLTAEHVGMEAQVVHVAGEAASAHHNLDTARLLGGRGLIVGVSSPGTALAQLQVDWNEGVDKAGQVIREAARVDDDASSFGSVLSVVMRSCLRSCVGRIDAAA